MKKATDEAVAFLYSTELHSKECEEDTDYVSSAYI